GQFSSVQTFITSTGTPTLAYLQTFNAVMVFTDGSCQDPTTFGNNLAQYIDGGGGVVSCTFDDASVPIQGNFNTNTYRVLLPASQTQGTMHSMGTVYLSSHPIMSGVSSFNGGTASYMSTSTTLAPGAYRIADYDNGAPLITARECVGPAGARRADLNFYPPSIDSRSDFWNTSTDGAKIMANALTWVTIANAVPTQPGTISGSVNVCPGNTGTYSITAVSGATSYSWSVTGGAVINSGNGTTSISVTFASSNSTISVTANNCAGPSVVRTLNVNVNAVTVNLGPAQTQCGGSVTLNAGNPGATYAWSNSATTQTISVSSTGTYSVVVTNATGCTGSGSVNVTINTPPTVNLGPDVTQCGGTVSLNAGNAVSYAWSNSATTSSISVSSTGTYSVVVTDGNGCTGSDVANVTINTPPTVNLGADVSQCGGTVTLDAQNAGSTYAWSESSTTQMISVSSSGTYSVVVTDANGCTGSDVINVAINTPPIVNLGADVTQCGGTVSLDAQNAGSTYAWSESSTTQTISVSSSGTYSVVVTDGNGCTGTDAVNVTINTPPTVTLNMPGTFACINWSSYALSGGSPSGGTYSGPGVSGGNFDPAAAGQGTWTIQYDYTDVNGCQGTATQNITVDLCTGVSSILNDDAVNVYPNPSNGTFTVNISTPGLQHVQLSVMDVQGRMIYTSEVSNTTNEFNRTISIEGLAQGVYTLKLLTNEGVVVKKLFIRE
ncbi:MAG TPA: T9SS type A sorting domain-containing protein, partial [Bacteroidia bacterium]